VLQLWLNWLVVRKDGEERDPTGDVQVAADGSGGDSLRRALVSSVLAVAARCRRVVRRARSGGGPHRQELDHHPEQYLASFGGSYRIEFSVGTAGEWIVAESLAVKHQLLIMRRSQRRAPNLTSWDRLILGFWTLWVSPQRLPKMAVISKAPTLLRFHQALVKRKYHLLYTSLRRRRPGPKGPSSALIAAVVEMKRRNPRFGCRKLAEQTPQRECVRSGTKCTIFAD